MDKERERSGRAMSHAWSRSDLVFGAPIMRYPHLSSFPTPLGSIRSLIERWGVIRVLHSKWNKHSPFSGAGMVRADRRQIRRLDNESYTRHSAVRKEGAPTSPSQPRPPLFRKGLFSLCVSKGGGGGGQALNKNIFSSPSSPSSADDPVKLLQFAIWDDDYAGSLLQGKKTQTFKFHRTKKTVYNSFYS